MSLVQCLLGVLIAWSFIFIRLPLWLWTAALTVYLLGSISVNGVSACTLLLILPLLVLFAFSFRPFRRQYLTRYLLAPFRRVLPVISPTEQTALDAGDVWWEGDLFRGLPNWQKLFKLPRNELTTEEQSFLDNQTNALCDLLDSWEIGRGKMDLPEAAWQQIKQEKFFGLIIPKEYGGRGFSALAHSAVVTRIASRDVSAAVTVMVPNSLGPAELLLHYGTDEQKQHYLPRLARAEEIPCFALTATEAGSDAGAIPDSGVICKGEHQGEEVLGMRLNWDKRYITLAPVATVLGLAFKLYDPDALLGDKKELGITLCLIPTDHPGVETGARHIAANCSFMNGPTRGQDVFIPLSWIIGGPNRIGQGWKMLMECLATGRGISLPALGTAATLLSYQTSGAYAAVRQQFNVAIGQFEGIQERLGRIGALAYLQSACRTMTLSAIDEGYNPAITTAMSKYHMTEMARTALNDALDIHGGKGVMLGPNNYLSTPYQGVPVMITVEGANILTRSLMIYGQGAIRCHPYVLKEINAAHHEDKVQGLKDFDKTLFSHVGYGLSNFVRTLTLGLTGGWYSPRQLTHGALLGPYLRQFSRFSSALAFVSDIAMLTLGGELKRKESLSARLGDVLSYLYLASAVVRYYRHYQKQNADEPYVRWALSHCLYEIEQAFKNFFDNFPQRSLAFALREIVFPFGLKASKPKDADNAAISESMQQDSEIRKRLCQINFNGKDNSGVAILERAFNQLLTLSPILQRIQQAVKNGQLNKRLDKNQRIDAAEQLKLLTAEEAQACREFEKLRLQVLNVDEFNPEFFS